MFSSQSQPGAYSAWRWTTLVFSLGFPSLVAWLYFVVLAPPNSKVGPGFLAMLMYAVGKTVQFSLPLAWFLGTQRVRLKVSKPKKSGIGLGLAFGLLTSAAILALYFVIFRGSPLFGDAPARVAAKLALFHADTPARFLGLALFLSIIHSFLEEYYWRWFVFRELESSISKRLAIGVSSLGFMGHHVIVLGVYFSLSLALPFSLGVAIGGAAWAWIYDRSGSLLPSWLSHALVDGAIMIVGYDMVWGAS
jgi:membrane protease YdiL (CAAX protease family)